MKSELKKLQEEALESAIWRGHTFGNKWSPTDSRSEHAGAMINCTKCGCQIVVLTNPMPNETKIFGKAVAVNCQD